MLGRADGGFAWWYVDLVGPEGDGVVVIWARALPFAPQSKGAAPGELSISVAGYRRGREVFYLLQTHPAASSGEGPGRLCIERSVFSFSERGGVVCLTAELDVDVPSCGRVQGRVEVNGAPALVPELRVAGHSWRPITAASPGHARLSWGTDHLSFAGRAYVDGNASSRPLRDLGIAEWRWGRIALPGRELVFFFVDPSDPAAPVERHVLTVGPSGRSVAVQGAASRTSEGSWSVYGLRRIDAIRIEADGIEPVTARFRYLVDDGPFYQRYIIEARSRTGEAGHGIAERVVPDRICAAWQAPLVRMRHHRVGEPASRWLPLFVGPAQGRWARLLASWGRAGSGRAGSAP